MTVSIITSSGNAVFGIISQYKHFSRSIFVTSGQTCTLHSVRKTRYGTTQVQIGGDNKR